MLAAGLEACPTSERLHHSVDEKGHEPTTGRTAGVARKTACSTRGTGVARSTTDARAGSLPNKGRLGRVEAACKGHPGRQECRPQARKPAPQEGLAHNGMPP